GLFAVYAMYRTSAFSHIVSASGSMWYPGFVEFAKSHKLAVSPEMLYLSLGDKESKTRNKIMEPVERNTAELHEYFRVLDIESVFELNPGNHFQDPAGRLAKGIAWVLRA
ncbi:MAG: alpha/beta hydrolase, partial [Ruminiclostridium sp.]|nr:alpha/beta hydrolase [Ruminiclostridium sp.]